MRYALPCLFEIFYSMRSFLDFPFVIFQACAIGHRTGTIAQPRRDCRLLLFSVSLTTVFGDSRRSHGIIGASVGLCIGG